MLYSTWCAVCCAAAVLGPAGVCTHAVPAPEGSASDVVLVEANSTDRVKQALLPHPLGQRHKLCLHTLADGHDTIC
jgi:hypothetical protein